MVKNFKDLRENFGLFTTGVAIATTIDGDETSHLITINSFSSVSLDPALLLFSIDNKSNSFAAFTKNRNFSISILAEDQIEISKIFSKTDKKSAKLDKMFFKSALGNLVLEDCLGYFECQTNKIIPAGDHHIIIGEIVNFSKINSDKKPLIYFKGNYQMW